MAYTFNHPNPISTGCPILNFALFAKFRVGGTEPNPYQDDFATPGISPRSANPRKHNRHNPNFRRNARGRPQILQRLCRRVENFGRGCLASRAFLNVSCIFSSLTLLAVVDT